MAAIYSNGGNRWNILGFNFTKRDALSSVYKISMGPLRVFAGPRANLLWGPYDIIIFKLDSSQSSYCKGPSISVCVCTIDPSKVNDVIMQHNSARGANTMEFPIGKFAGGANTTVKTIDSRCRP